MKAAIDILKEALRSALVHRAEGFSVYAVEPERSLRQAIAVLEAAGKIKKNDWLDYLNFIHDQSMSWLSHIERKMRSFLELLPDKPDEEKP